jgi:hypothetical protein
MSFGGSGGGGLSRSGSVAASKAARSAAASRELRATLCSGNTGALFQ